MDKQVLIIKNEHIKAPGLIRTVLQENRLLFDIFNAKGRTNFPDSKEYKAVIVLGGHQSVNDPSMRHELDFIGKTVQSGIPYFGVCLGAQALAKTAGGRVYESPFKEIGCRDSAGNYFQVELTEEGSLDGIAQGISSPFKVFQLHGETFELGNDTKLLGKNYGSSQMSNQFIKVGRNAYGLQPHVELVNPMLNRWLKGSKELQSLVADELKRDYRDVGAEYQRNGRILISNFLKIAGMGV